MNDEPTLDFDADDILSIEQVCAFDDLELDARVMWSCAKMRIVAAMFGTDDETLAQRMDTMPDDERCAVLRMMERVRVDPVTGSGLH